jgi:XTP/dITP diphosphohydrolase
MKEILVASQNSKKLNELKMILQDENAILMSLKDLNDFDDVIEDGSSFFENALIKAKYFAKKHQKITISDDSGLEVYALNFAPGIFSARYSGFGDEANNLKLLEEMKDKKDRRARFVSSIVIYFPNDTYYHFQGTIEGVILDEQRGDQGFGYDPLFFVESYNKTFAELDINIKNKISHRAKALHQLKEVFCEIINHE